MNMINSMTNKKLMTVAIALDAFIPKYSTKSEMLEIIYENCDKIILGHYNDETFNFIRFKYKLIMFLEITKIIIRLSCNRIIDNLPNITTCLCISIYYNNYIPNSIKTLNLVVIKNKSSPNFTNKICNLNIEYYENKVLKLPFKLKRINICGLNFKMIIPKQTRGMINYRKIK